MDCAAKESHCEGEELSVKARNFSVKACAGEESHGEGQKYFM